MSNSSEDLPDLQMTLGIAAFIDALDKSYPHRCIKADEDMVSAHRYAAIREFIDELLSLKEELQEGYDEDTGDVSG